jgi:hypothetical protein
VDSTLKLAMEWPHTFFSVRHSLLFNMTLPMQLKVFQELVTEVVLHFFIKRVHRCDAYTMKSKFQVSIYKVFLHFAFTFCGPSHSS